MLHSSIGLVFLEKKIAFLFLNKYCSREYTTVPFSTYKVLYAK